MGITFSPLTLFALPNGARRAPDASWLKKERWQALTDDEQDNLTPVCPDFVLELMSPSDSRQGRFKMLQSKMTEYIENGAQLGWLVDPFKKDVYIYWPGQTVECLSNPTKISGDPILPGFIFSFADIWQ
jgi:Uma2 family endonuclease